MFEERRGGRDFDYLICDITNSHVVRAGGVGGEERGAKNKTIASNHVRDPSLTSVTYLLCSVFMRI